VARPAMQDGGAMGMGRTLAVHARAHATRTLPCTRCRKYRGYERGRETSYALIPSYLVSKRLRLQVEKSDASTILQCFAIQLQNVQRRGNWVD
jgi:hypothetical protein